MAAAERYFDAVLGVDDPGLTSYTAGVTVTWLTLEAKVDPAGQPAGVMRSLIDTPSPRSVRPRSLALLR